MKLKNFIAVFGICLLGCLNASDEVNETSHSHDLQKRINSFRQAAELGDENAKRHLPDALSEYAVFLYKGQNGVARNIPLAIKHFREAAALGNEDAIRNLPIALVEQQAIRLNSFTKDKPKVLIEYLRGSTALEDQLAKQHLPEVLRLCSAWLFNGEEGVTRNMPIAIEFCREAAALNEEDAKENLPKMLGLYSALLFTGKEGITKDIPPAIELCKEAAALDDERAKKNLPEMLRMYSAWLFSGEEGFTKDTANAIELCKEAAALGDKNAIHNLSIMERQSGSFKGNWTKIFETRVGQILHTPDATHFGGMICGKSLNLNCKEVNGIPLTAPLTLVTDSSEEEFVAALKRSGIM